MAKNKIAIEIAIESLDASKSIKELKENISGLTDALLSVEKGTDEYNNLAESIQKAKKRLNDLNQDIQNTTTVAKLDQISNIGTKIAAGFSLAQGAMALFGTESKDVEKALLKVQAAQAILQGFKELEGAVGALKNARDAIVSMGKGIANYIKGLEGATAAQKVFNFIASLNPVGIIIAAVAALSAGILILARNMQTATDETLAFKKSMEQANTAIGYQIKGNELLIKMLEGVYGKEKELGELRAKNLGLQIEQSKNSRDAIIKELADTEATLMVYRKKVGDNFVTNLNPGVTKMEERIAELKRQLTKNAEDFKGLKAQQINDDLKDKGEQQKKNDEQAKKDAEAYKKKREEQRQQMLKESMMDHVESTLLDTKNNDELLKSTIDWEKLRQEKQAEIDAYYAQKKKERDERNRQFAVTSTVEGLEVLQQFVSAFAGKSEEQQRRAFNINKAAQIAETTINTITAAQKAYASQIIPGDPTSLVRGAIAAALATSAGVARVALIARTQFGSTGTGGSLGNVAGGGTGGSFNPNIQNSTGNTSTILSNIGNNTSQAQQPPIKVFVTETDISNVQNNVNQIKQKALIE